MSLLSNINSTQQPEGIRMVIAGAEKVGKTTLASQAPKALLVPLEIGYGGVLCDKTPMVHSWQEVEEFMLQTIHYAQLKQFPYKTIVFDSATAIEKLIHKKILEMDPAYGKTGKNLVTMHSAHGGYGKAFLLSNDLYSTFLSQCDQLAVYGNINIILTCHIFPDKIIDPNSGEYASWDLQLHSPKNQVTFGKREMTTQWADIIGFFYEPMFVSKGEGETMSRGISHNKGRMLGLSRTPSYVAGNRYGMEGEIAISPENSWNHFADVLYKAKGIDVYTR